MAIRSNRVLDNDAQVITKSMNLSVSFLSLVGLVTTDLLSFSRFASGFTGSVTSSNGVVSPGSCEVSSYYFTWVVFRIT